MILLSSLCERGGRGNSGDRILSVSSFVWERGKGCQQALVLATRQLGTIRELLLEKSLEGSVYTTLGGKNYISAL